MFLKAEFINCVSQELVKKRLIRVIMHCNTTYLLSQLFLKGNVFVGMRDMYPVITGRHIARLTPVAMRCRSCMESSGNFPVPRTLRMTGGSSKATRHRCSMVTNKKFVTKKAQKGN